MEHPQPDTDRSSARCCGPCRLAHASHVPTMRSSRGSKRDSRSYSRLEFWTAASRAYPRSESQILSSSPDASSVPATRADARTSTRSFSSRTTWTSQQSELLSLEARKAELQSRLDAPDMPELVHPRMADVYREKVRSLCLALEGEESRTEAVQAIRALIEAILWSRTASNCRSR